MPVGRLGPEPEPEPKPESEPEPEHERVPVPREELGERLVKGGELYGEEFGVQRNRLMGRSIRGVTSKEQFLDIELTLSRIG